METSTNKTLPAALPLVPFLQRLPVSVDGFPRALDFSPQFAQIVLTITPSVILLALAAARWIFLLGREKCITRGRPLMFAKLVCYSIYFII